LASMSSDPRDAGLEMPFKLPPGWSKSPDGVASASLFLSSASLLTRNRFLAWLTLALALCAHFNRQPLRTQQGNAGTLSAVLFALGALSICYFAGAFLPPEAIEYTSVPIPQTP